MKRNPTLTILGLDKGKALMYTFNMQGKTKPLIRYLGLAISALLKGKYSGLILGPRQVGKTTLVKELLKNINNVVEYPLQDTQLRERRGRP